MIQNGDKAITEYSYFRYLFLIICFMGYDIRMDIEIREEVEFPSRGHY